jgi:Kef-type K+ transport system membrane component KefB
LSKSINSHLIIDKLRTISYGIFIPVFFVVIGMETDIGVFSESLSIVGIVLVIALTSIIAKFTSGWLAGKLIGFTQRESAIIGFSTIPQLSTTLAVVFTAVELGLLPPTLITAMVILSIVTTLVAPVGLRMLIDKT